MAHFAKISEQNEVLDIVKFGDDSLIFDENGVESETVGQQYLESNHNWPSHLWIKTSYNTINNTHRLGGTPYRGNYACIGGTWDSANNIFWHPKPFASWVKNTQEARWQSPLGDAPVISNQEISDGSYEYVWDEDAYQADNTTGWTLTNSLA